MANPSTPGSSLAYVADKALPELPAPSDTKGPIAWIKANLFSSIRDSILTIVALVAVVYAISSILPWLVNATWDADSLRQCREFNTGACFAVVYRRFSQFMFGFYPSAEYWRPILAFILMFVAAAPLLHDNLPRKMLWFSAAFPLLAYWLLWGGSIWGILLVVAALFAAVYLFRYLTTVVNSTLAAMGAVITLGLWFYFLQAPVSSGTTSAIGFVGLLPVESAKFGGFLLTFVIGVTGIVASFPLGIVLALGRKSDMPVVKMLCVGFIEFIRGVPLITLLFVASTLLNYFLPPGTSFDLILRVLIMVTLFASAYMAEVVRGGLAALPRGQYEAADALGLNYWQSTQHIILPQALKVSIPGIVSTFIGLFKDTTLVSIIGLLDPIGIMQPIRSNQAWNGIVWELYIFVGLIFFLFCFTMSRYSMYFERKLDTGHRN